MTDIACLDQVDAFDLALLSLLQRDGDLTAEQLSAQVPLSPSAIRRRIRRQRHRGLIRGFVAILDDRSPGTGVLCVTGVTLREEERIGVDTLEQWFRERPEIQQAYFVTGDFDFMLVVATRRLDDYQELMKDMMEAHPIVARYQTNVVLRSTKRGLALALPTGRNRTAEGCSRP